VKAEVMGDFFFLFQLQVATLIFFAAGRVKVMALGIIRRGDLGRRHPRRRP